MRVNVVTEPHGWILHRCAQELADRLPNVTVNGHRSAADLNYFLPAYFRNMARETRETRAVKVGFFTHPTDEQVAEFAPLCHGHVAMNQHVAARLRAAGADPVVIRPGALQGKQPITFGVCGRIYKTGRKGESLVTQMVQAGYRVVSWGTGWPCPTTGSSLGDLTRFYRGIDYLVVTSLLEGGPMPVVDAIAHGVPVIAPDTGWCWEFPVIRYERGSWESLRAVLEALKQPPTWEAWAEGHRLLFARLETLH